MSDILCAWFSQNGNTLPLSYVTGFTNTSCILPVVEIDHCQFFFATKGSLLTCFLTSTYIAAFRHVITNRRKNCMETDITIRNVACNKNKSFNFSLIDHFYFVFEYCGKKRHIRIIIFEILTPFCSFLQFSSAGCIFFFGLFYPWVQHV